jgi:hypothetical protein
MKCTKFLSNHYNLPSIGCTELQEIMIDYEWRDALVPEIGYQLQTNRTLFEKTAKEWTQKYAKPLE